MKEVVIVATPPTAPQAETRLLVSDRTDSPSTGVGLLSISGSVSQDGTVSIRSLDELANGEPTRSRGGSGFSIVVLDPGGAVLAEHDGDLNFDRPTSDPQATRWKTLPIGVSIDYPQGASAMEFREGAKVLLRIDPLSWTLRTTVEQIPERGFVKNASERKKALLAMVDAVEKMLDNGAYQGAYEKLDRDFRQKVSDWLVTDYPHRQVLEANQATVSAQVDRVLMRIQYLQTHGSTQH